MKQCKTCIYYTPKLKDVGWCNVFKNDYLVPSMVREYTYCDRWEDNEAYCKCPHCDEIITEKEAESVCDCGCPLCRVHYDVEDYKIQ